VDPSGGVATDEHGVEAVHRLSDVEVLQFAVAPVVVEGCCRRRGRVRKGEEGVEREEGGASVRIQASDRH
jgi:hypothetical protein